MSSSMARGPSTPPAGNAPRSLEVLVDDGKDEAGSDVRLLVTQLRDALGNLNLNEGRREKRTHATEALGKLLQQLFDDPTLKVKIKSSEVDGDSWTKLKIEGRCPTAYGVPALYIAGEDKLMSPGDAEGAPDSVQGGVPAYRDAVYAPVYNATCQLSLPDHQYSGHYGPIVRGVSRRQDLSLPYLQVHAGRHGTLSPERDTGDRDEYASKFEVIRRTARMLRESYAKVHTGARANFHPSRAGGAASGGRPDRRRAAVHKHDFVHGDVRPGNVMLQRLGPGPASRTFKTTDTDSGGLNLAIANIDGAAAGAYLIDFDWAGKEGEARYPAETVHPDGKWPRPASELRGQPIRKVHDVFMLENRLLGPDRLKRKREDDEGQGHSEVEYPLP
ncbi:hypothetical protein LXA43DRAFT_1098276 [Ganoderma leucocontextum]|nr:hypothetical protein LXA43DRAFT_1098276 [Ganoderma leucocontextum]